MTTLITFLGTYPYRTVQYIAPFSDNRRVETCYVARALAEFYSVDAAKVLATDEAWATHGEGFGKALQECGIKPQRIPIEEGRTEEQLRNQFRKMRDALSETDALVVDITHGFRAQPFFAATALAVMAAANELPEEVRICYTYVDKDTTEALVWDLTFYLLLQRLAFGISTFLQTGHAGPLVKALREEESRLQERARNEEREFPRVGTLIGAIERFANDLVTLRVPALTLGADGSGQKSSAQLLVNAVQTYEKQQSDDLIALRPLLDDLVGMAEGLVSDTLFGQQGQRAMSHLGHLYVRFHRYAEAAGLGAEALICRYADSPAATDAGQPTFDRKARDAASHRCSEAKGNRGLLDIRNDLLHAGFRSDPSPAHALVENVSRLCDLISTPSPHHLRHASCRGAGVGGAAGHRGGRDGRTSRSGNHQSRRSRHRHTAGASGRRNLPPRRALQTSLHEHPAGTPGPRAFRR